MPTTKQELEARIRKLRAERDIAEVDLAECQEKLAQQQPPEPTYLAHDDCTNPDPLPLWRELAAAYAHRHRWWADSGPDNKPFRRLLTVQGDNYGGWGQRTELGRNNRDDTFCLYREGERRTTRFWMRFPEGLADATKWQNVWQMKQVQPYASDNPVGAAIECQVYGGKLRLRSFWEDLWVIDAPPAGEWFETVIEARYSADPSVGYFHGTVAGQNIYPPSGQTLSRDAGNNNVPIPSHLRIGVYHDTSLAGTHVDYADIRVS